MAPDDIRARRKGLGLSQPQLAEYLGVSASTVRKWEQGLRVCTWPEWSLRLAFTLADKSQAAGAPLPNLNSLLTSTGPRVYLGPVAHSTGEGPTA